MPSTEDMNRLDMTDLSFLLVGEPGTGKTNFLRNMPKPLFVFDFDNGMRTLAGVKGITYETYRDGPYGMDTLTGDDLYKWGDSWKYAMDMIVQLSAKNEYASVAVDTISFGQEACKNFVRRRNPAKQGPTVMELPQWGDVGNYMRSFLDVFTMLRCNKVATCHIDRAMNPQTETVELLPLMDGAMKGKIASFFDEVLYTNIKKEGAGPDAKYRYVLQSVQAGLYKAARTRIGIPDGTDSNWESVVRAVEQADKATATRVGSPAEQAPARTGTVRTPVSAKK